MAPRLRFNEGKACDAILRRLEAREGARRTNLRSPERERHPAPVELACEIGGRLFAIEHTGIEPFPGHMQLEAEAGVQFRPIESMVAGRLPPNEHFELHMPVKATQGLKGGALRRLHETIASWIVDTAPTLPIARFGRYVTPIRWITLPGVPFQVTLHRTTTEGFPPRFTIRHMVEANHEAERVERISEACQRKYPKLARWKHDHGARTVLVLEENDIQLTNQQVVADALIEVEQTMPDRPDEVYLVSTAVETAWWTFALRVGQRDHYEFSRAFECAEEIDPATLIDLTGR
jgi:hypothetical protein